MALAFVNPLAAFAILIFGGSTVADNEPSVIPDTECVGIACMRDHRTNTVTRPDRDDDGDNSDDDEDDDDDSKPGHGWGDRNHDHSGPPGRNRS